MFTSQPFVETKFIGPTNFRPARVKVTHLTTGKSKTFSWDHGKNAAEMHEYAARKMLAESGDHWIVTGDLLACGTKRGYIFTVKPVKL